MAKSNPIKAREQLVRNQPTIYFSISKMYLRASMLKHWMFSFITPTIVKLLGSATVL